MNKFEHKSVLLKEVLESFKYLKDKKSPVFVDGTVGNAGHSISIIKNLKLKDQNENKKLRIIGIDKDITALKISKKNTEESSLDKHFEFIHDDFFNINEILLKLNIKTIDGAMLDLGVSSIQLDNKSRGFSFEDLNRPLDMRMNRDQYLTAKEVINNYPGWKLERVLQEGEEKFHKKITKNIVGARKKSKIKTVGDLIEVLKISIPKNLQYRKTHFATATFRALRIEVNSELKGLGKAISDIVESLKPRSRLVIITFHSLEDRIVKHKFRELEKPCICHPKQQFCTCGRKPKVKVITRKPIVPADDEILSNPRSRSAKLRIVEKIEVHVD